MKKAHKAVGIAAAGIIALSTFGLSFAYSNNMTNDNVSVVAQNINSTNDTAQIDDYELNMSEFEINISDAQAKKDEYLAVNNTYGLFSLLTENGKIKKYKLGDNDLSKKYLVKGTASFNKKEITFDGYFLVDNTLTGNQKGQVTMYKGKFDFPNGDKFDGYLSSGKYYYSGTYTWKDGQSYTGKYTSSNKIGASAIGKNEASAYGTFYFDSSKKTYLYVRFVNGMPSKSGYYKTSTGKYLVTFDENGNCISTSKVKA